MPDRALLDQFADEGASRAASGFAHERGIAEAEGLEPDGAVRLRGRPC